MNTTDFTYILQHPQSITATQISDVKSIINEFPYFQSARAIYLKGLKNKESFKYNQELKTTAAYTTDRSILFDFITSKEFLQNEISQHIKHNTEHLKAIEVSDIEDISVNKSVIIDDALRQQIKDTEPILDPALFEAKVEAITPEDVIDIDVSNIQKTPEETLEIGKPLTFNKNEVHSFSEWLKITSFKLIIREDEETKVESSPKNDQEKKFELIDKFIASKAKIQPIKKDVPTYNIAKAQMIQPEALMTETLARIYVEQKNYSKAIQSYKVLSLKYPEKSGFFADQIQAVKELQEQNNI
ncbi:FIG00648993: hypothetical protein [hydrothermal vent metagenome]|uniref:Tetratricopeptide repeat protein n=1 Tax=hydrothermal vent metagenome TaxID=652676 RepID=A0A3B0RF02_9ZZZZ